MYKTRSIYKSKIERTFIEPIVLLQASFVLQLAYIVLYSIA